MKKEIIECDGCAKQIYGTEHAIELPTGDREPDSQIAGGWQRQVCKHDLCEDCRARLCRFIIGILAFDFCEEADIKTRSPSPVKYRADTLGATVCAIASIRHDRVHAILCEVITYGKVEDRPGVTEKVDA